MAGNAGEIYLRGVRYNYTTSDQAKQPAPFSLSGHFGRKKTVPDNSNISLTYKANLSILPAIKRNFLSNIKYTSEKEDSTYEI